MLLRLLYFDNRVLQAYVNVCCQINHPAALKCNSAFKKHNELVKQMKQNDVNNVANVKKKPLSFVYGADLLSSFTTQLCYMIVDLQNLISKP